MEYLFIDEKGPQGTFKISKPFNKVNKLSYGTDDMHLYVADVVKIREKDLVSIEKSYWKMEAKYLSTRQFKNNKELKGQNVLEKKRFKFGVASLKGHDLDFYSSLFGMLIDHDVENLLFSISKMSIIIDSRLNEWIFSMCEKLNRSPTLLKYSLSKYAEIECSENVISSLLDKSVSIDRVLYEIQQDLINIISQNEKNLRMSLQLKNYSELLWLINQTESSDLVEPKLEVAFNWEKFRSPMDLWLTEIYSSETYKDISVILDEGIPIEPIEDFKFYEIKVNEKSDEHVGLRIADMLVVIAGKYMSKLSSANKYDLDNPTERKQLSSEWFQFDGSQFYLMKLMSKYFFNESRKYGYGVDTFFDESVLFETFVLYVQMYETYEEYSKLSGDEHSNKHFHYMVKKMEEKWYGVEK